MVITRGAVCALVGDSGSGKSLIASSIMGILAENLTVEGEVLFRGRNLLSLTERQLHAIRGKQIGIVMQSTAGSLNPLLSNGRQMALVIREHCPNKDVHRIAVEALEKVRLQNPEQILRQYPHQLSGGMKQRLLTAIGIAGSPDLLIMDEPTKGLDLTLRGQIADMIDRLHRETGVTILLITHDMEMAYRLSDTCYVLRRGAVTARGKTRPLFDMAADQTLSELLGAEQALAGYFREQSVQGEGRRRNA